MIGPDCSGPWGYCDIWLYHHKPTTPIPLPLNLKDVVVFVWFHWIDTRGKQKKTASSSAAVQLFYKSNSTKKYVSVDGSLPPTRQVGPFGCRQRLLHHVLPGTFTPSRLQPRSGDKPLKLEVLCRHSGTAVPEGLICTGTVQNPAVVDATLYCKHLLHQYTVVCAARQPARPTISSDSSSEMINRELTQRA